MYGRGWSQSGANSTYYAPLMGGCALLGTATEANTQFQAAFGGTVRKLGCNVLSNARASTTTVRLRIDGADATNQSISITAGATGFFESAAADDTFTDGQKLNVSSTTGTGLSPVIKFGGFWAEVETTTDQWNAFAVGSVAAGIWMGKNTTRYCCVAGRIATSFGTTEADQQTKIRAAGTIYDPHVTVTANTAANNCSAWVRINGANEIEVSITAGTTGLFVRTDLQHRVEVDDLLNWAFAVPTEAGSGAMTVLRAGMSILQDDARYGVAAQSSYGVQWSEASGTTRYSPMFGAPGLFATESDVQVALPHAARLSRLRCQVTSFSGAALTLKTHVDGADGAQSISVTGNGWFEDVANADEVAAGGKVAVAIYAAGTSACWIYNVGLRVGNDPATPAGSMGLGMVVVT